jgi:hypothetical protein
MASGNPNANRRGQHRRQPSRMVTIRTARTKTILDQPIRDKCVRVMEHYRNRLCLPVRPGGRQQRPRKHLRVAILSPRPNRNGHDAHRQPLNNSSDNFLRRSIPVWRHPIMPSTCHRVYYFIGGMNGSTPVRAANTFCHFWPRILAKREENLPNGAISLPKLRVTI